MTAETDMQSPDRPESGQAFDFGMTEIEERLRADHDGSYRAGLVAMLDATREDLEKRMDEGLPPADYERAGAILISLAAARELVVAFR